MTEITDVNFLISTQQNKPSNNIEFEFDDTQAESQLQNLNQTQEQKEQTLLEVLDDSGEICEEIPDDSSQFEASQDELNRTSNWNQSQGELLQLEESGILEERLSDYEEFEETFEEERLSDYEERETSNNKNEYPGEHYSESNINQISNCNTKYQSSEPTILNFSLSPPSGMNRPFELPIIKKQPIIITSKSISKPSYTKKVQQPLTQGTKRAMDQCDQNLNNPNPLVKQSKIGLSNQIARTFRVVTSSKTLANSYSPKAVITRNPLVQKQDVPQKIIINEEVCIKKESKNGTNYDSDSEVLLGFDPQSGSFRTKTGVKLEPTQDSSFSDEEKNESQEPSISAADFDSFQCSFNSTVNTEESSQTISDSDISISENSTTIVKVPSKTKILENFSRTHRPKLQTQITKTSNRTVITKILPRFVSTKPNNKRTSDEMNVALAMQKLKDSNTQVQNETELSKKSNFQKSIELELDDENDKLIFALARLFMECNIPLGVVEDCSFKEFIRLLKPDFVAKLPGSKELLQTILKL